MRKIHWEKNKKKAFWAVFFLVVVLNILDLFYFGLIDPKVGITIGIIVILIFGILSESIIKMGNFF